jgi:hypothetical protein
LKRCSARGGQVGGHGWIYGTTNSFHGEITLRWKLLQINGFQVLHRSPAGPAAFVEFPVRHPASSAEGGEMTPWEAFVFRQLTSARDANDLPVFRCWLQDEPCVPNHGS